MKKEYLNEMSIRTLNKMYYKWLFVNDKQADFIVQLLGDCITENVGRLLGINPENVTTRDIRKAILIESQ